jgi:hypothetical protein
MVIPEELLKMSEKELKEALPDNIFKATYIQHHSEIYKILHKLNKILTVYSYTDKVITTISNQLHEDYYEPFTISSFKIAVESKREKYLKTLDVDKFINWIESVVKSYIDEDKYDIQKINESRVELILYYPEISITNSVEFKHTLRDVYLKYIFIKSKNLWGFNSISMCRNTYTEKEWLDYYMHSHIAVSYLNSYSSSFCMGSNTPTSNLLTQFQKNLLKFREFILLFEAYLSWESIEGKPYRYIENVLKPIEANYDFIGLEVIPDYITVVYTLTKRVLSILQDIQFDYIPLVFSRNYTIILKQSTVDEIDELLTKEYPEYCYTVLDDNTVKLKERVRLTVNGKHTDIYFKGENKLITIIPEKDTVKEDLPIKIHRSLLNSVTKEIKEQFEQFIINKILG